MRMEKRRSWRLILERNMRIVRMERSRMIVVVRMVGMERSKRMRMEKVQMLVLLVVE